MPRAAQVLTKTDSSTEWLKRRHRWWLASVGLAAAVVLAAVGVATGVSPLELAILAAGVVLVGMAVGWRAWYGLYLPGSALFGWAAGAVLDKTLHPSVLLSLVGLGCGLVAAFLIRRSQVPWPPLWPLAIGVVLTGLGVLTGIADPWTVFWLGWPLLIVEAAVVLAACVVVPQRRAKRRAERSLHANKADGRQER